MLLINSYIYYEQSKQNSEFKLRKILFFDAQFLDDEYMKDYRRLQKENVNRL